MKKDEMERFTGNIYLCGFMASGKSTLGRVLALKGDRNFCDLDEVIVEREGMSIREIFEKKGGPYFRNKEREYLLDLAESFSGIISLGGGALHNQEVVDLLKQSGLLVFVDTPMEVITNRVFNSDERPILFKKDGKIKMKETLFTELKALYLGRENFYKQAHIHIQTQLYPSVEEMAEALIAKISRHV